MSNPGPICAFKGAKQTKGIPIFVYSLVQNLSYALKFMTYLKDVLELLPAFKLHSLLPVFLCAIMKRSGALLGGG